jgi:hypothetical protein
MGYTDDPSLGKFWIKKEEKKKKATDFRHPRTIKSRKKR